MADWRLAILIEKFYNVWTSSSFTDLLTTFCYRYFESHFLGFLKEDLFYFSLNNFSKIFGILKRLVNTILTTAKVMNFNNGIANSNLLSLSLSTTSLTAIRDVIKMSRGLWKGSFSYQRLITPSLGLMQIAVDLHAMDTMPRWHCHPQSCLSVVSTANLNSDTHNIVSYWKSVTCNHVSRLSRSVTASWSSTGPVTGGPLRYRACKSVLSTNNPSVRKNKEHLLTKLTQFYFILLG